ncbi:MAG: hypothetical protein Q8K36_05450 [Alphaproteobacteria bacterium]|nr:hypothetical protein [Alphaproteobacteria bacterium]
MLDKQILERLFNMNLKMNPGAVLNFSVPKFNSFFREFGIDIEDPKYGGESKAKRLSQFWALEPDSIVGKILGELLKWWDDINPNERQTTDRIKAEEIVCRLLGSKQKETLNNNILKNDFGTISFKDLPIDSNLVELLEYRYKEACECLINNIPLAATILIGSILEGALFAVAIKNPKRFNQAPTAPKNSEGKVKEFNDWTLSDFINVAHSIGVLKLDTKDFSHALRTFRNYIHIQQQQKSKFDPDKHTAKICLQVLEKAITELSE